MHWWEKEPLRIVEFSSSSFCSEEISRSALSKEAETVRKLGGNAQHFQCVGSSAGWDDKRFFFETRVAKVKNPDRLKAYLPLAHKRGIRVIVYFNCHWYNKEFGKEHPNWLQIKEDGKPVDNLYGTGTRFCINNPHFRQWVFQILRDLLKYEIDGIFYDGAGFGVSTCYCPECKRLFRERTGEEIPPKSDHQHPLWKDLIDFQAESRAKFYSDSNAIIKDVNSEILFYVNANGNWPTWTNGRDNHKIIKHVDILGAEGGFIYGDLNQTSIYKPGIIAKLLSQQSKGKPVIVFDCAGHKPWSWYSLPETEVALLLAETLAGGANYWVALSPDDCGAKAVKEYNQFIKKNPDTFFKTESLARIALLWPSASANFYTGSSIPLTDLTEKRPAEGIGDISQEFSGFYEGLARAQVPFDIIEQENLKDLSNYQLLVLPNVACLSQEAIKGLRDFVKKGGNLVASFETSLYNETGKRKNNFQLSKLFGVDFNKELFGPMNWDYIAPVAKNNPPLLNNITGKYLPAPSYGIKVEPTTGKPYLYFRERLKGRYDGIPEVSSQPFLVLNRFGKGKALYLAGTFGLDLANFRFPEYLGLVKNFSSQLSQVPVRIEKAPWIEVSLRKKKNKVFLHLINQASGLKRPLTHIAPLTNLRIGLFGMKVKEGYALRTNKKLKLKRSGKETSLILPYLKDYEVICLK